MYWIWDEYYKIINQESQLITAAGVLVYLLFKMWILSQIKPAVPTYVTPYSLIMPEYFIIIFHLPVDQHQRRWIICNCVKCGDYKL
jgi:hypothetical protein